MVRAGWVGGATRNAPLHDHQSGVGFCHPICGVCAGTKIFVTKKVDEIMNDRGKKIDTRAACSALFGVIAFEVAKLEQRGQR